MNKKNPLNLTILFTALGFLGPGLKFLLLPLYLQFLDPVDYGIIALLTVFSAFIGLIANLKLDTALRIQFFDYYQDEDQVFQFLRSIFTTVFLLCLIFFTILLITGPWLFKFIFNEAEMTFYPYGMLAIAGELGNILVGVYLIFLRNKTMIREYTVYTLLALFLSVTLQLYFLVVHHMGVLGILLGGMIPNLLLAAIILVHKRLITIKNYHQKMIRNSLRFALPLIPFVLLEFITFRGDRYFVGLFLDLEEVGLYSVLITITGLVVILLNALDNALRPLLYDWFKIGIVQNRLKIMAAYNLYILAGLVCLFGLLLIGSHLEWLTSKPKYLSIKPYFGVAVLSMLPLVFTRIFNLQLMYLQRSRELSILTFYKTLVVIILFLILIPLWKLWGALTALLISNLFSMSIFWYKTIQDIKFTYNWKIVGLSTFSFLLGIGSYYWLDLYLHSYWIIVEFLLFVGLLIVTYLRFIAPHFVNTIKLKD